MAVFLEALSSFLEKSLLHSSPAPLGHVLGRERSPQTTVCRWHRPFETDIPEIGWDPSVWVQILHRCEMRSLLPQSNRTCRRWPHSLVDRLVGRNWRDRRQRVCREGNPFSQLRGRTSPNQLTVNSTGWRSRSVSEGESPFSENIGDHRGPASLWLNGRNRGGSAIASKHRTDKEHQTLVIGKGF